MEGQDTRMRKIFQVVFAVLGVYAGLLVGSSASAQCYSSYGYRGVNHGFRYGHNVGYNYGYYPSYYYTHYVPAGYGSTSTEALVKELLLRKYLQDNIGSVYGNGADRSIKPGSTPQLSAEEIELLKSVIKQAETQPK